jgi:translation initiation factor 1 (eIF-1/SUI1)
MCGHDWCSVRISKEIQDFASRQGRRLRARLAKELKKTCGTGGSVQGDNIELQGDCVPRAKTWLEGRGYSVRG